MPDSEDDHPCIACGCTEDDACVDENDEPCAWLFPKLCSQCADITLRSVRELYGTAERAETTLEQFERLLARQLAELRRQRAAVVVKSRIGLRRGRRG